MSAQSAAPSPSPVEKRPCAQAARSLEELGREGRPHRV